MSIKTDYDKGRCPCCGYSDYPLSLQLGERVSVCSRCSTCLPVVNERFRELFLSAIITGIDDEELYAQWVKVNA